MIDETTVAQRYRVVRKVGEGGMAVVYLGRDLLLNRDVAIKALHPQHASDRGFRTRFEREAQAAATFTHPNIIDIFDVGEEGGTPYIVMEYVRGQTLKEIIEAEGPFHPDDVAALVEQVGAALDYAHERGYVHRDVKPQNILVDGRGQAKVVDFGIAKGLSDAHLTEVGTELGTVHYISPEQASGLMATPASDVYSLGVVAFEMLTKRLPFEAETPVAIAVRHVHDEPPAPSTVAPGVPPEVDAVVLRSLAKDPTKRYPSAGAFAQALSEWRGTGWDGAAASRAVASAAAVAPPPPAPVAAPVPVPAPARAPSPPPPRAAPAAGGRQGDVGCGTWLVGSVILLSLVALIVAGFRLSPRLASIGDDGGGPTATVAAEPEPTEIAAAAAEEPAPTAPPAAGAAGPPPTAVTASAAVPVPDLTGMTELDAAAAANARGFQLAVAEPVFSDAVEPDRVAEQDPPPDSPLAQGQTVYVKLSRGSATIDLGGLGLVGKTAEEARSILAGQGLGASTDQVRSADVAEGLVVGFDPPETATVGDTVTLHLSAGDQVQIPAALVGQPVARAEAQLDGLGLRLGERRDVDRGEVERRGLDLATDEIADGDVVGVEGEGVALDAWVAPGSAVTLVVYERDRDGA